MNSAKMMDDSNRAEEIRHASHMKMTETGEVERLKDLLRTRLVECGWKDKMKVVCKETIREKGVENITVEELVAEITPIGRKEIPDSVKKELLQKITKFFEGR